MSTDIRSIEDQGLWGFVTCFHPFKASIFVIIHDDQLARSGF